MLWWKEGKLKQIHSLLLNSKKSLGWYISVHMQRTLKERQNKQKTCLSLLKCRPAACITIVTLHLLWLSTVWRLQHCVGCSTVSTYLQRNTHKLTCIHRDCPLYDIKYWTLIGLLSGNDTLLSVLVMLILQYVYTYILIYNIYIIISNSLC